MESFFYVLTPKKVAKSWLKAGILSYKYAQELCKRRLPMEYASIPGGKASENESDLFQTLCSVEARELPSEDGNADSLMCIVDEICGISEEITESHADKG